jgi:hypothetical protein
MDLIEAAKAGETVCSGGKLSVFAGSERNRALRQGVWILGELV